MFKFSTIVALIGLSLVAVAVNGEPPRFRSTNRRFIAVRSRNHQKFARQEAAATAAPYPAAGVTPEIPFNLPNEPDQTYGPPEPKPDETYGPPEEPTPDQTYGPPEEPTPDQTYLPPEDEGAVTEPDTTYGPPEDEQSNTEEVLPEEPIPVDAELVSLNIIQPRKKLILSRLRSAPLRQRNSLSRRGNFVEIIRSEPILVYTLH